jgi:hypothetical protein
MISTRFYFFTGILCLALASCDKTKRVDGSSDEKMKASIEEMRKGLTDAEKEQLGKDMMAVAFADVNLFQAGHAPDLFQQQMRDRLNGKTRQEIHQLAEDARKRLEASAEESRKRSEALAEESRRNAEMFAKEAKAREELAEAKAKEEAVKRVAQVQGEIAELIQQERKAAADAEAIKKFEVKRSRFYFSEGRFSKDPIIELTVKNGTNSAISKVSFQGVLSSPGRAVPWVKDDFNYAISGGLEPGEETTWKLAPNMFGEWGKVAKDRSDYVLTVRTVSLYGADEKVMLDSEFPEQKSKRLQQLKDSLSELQKP